MSLQGVQDALSAPEADVSLQEAEVYMSLEQEDNDETNWGQDSASVGPAMALPTSDPMSNSPEGSGGNLQCLIEELSIEVAEGTDRSYRRLMMHFDAWLVAHGYILPNTTIFSMPVQQRAPEFLIAWIMSHCDSRNPDGSFKLASEYTRTLSHAMKMRSSATYGFSRNPHIGNTPWNEVNGQWVGNPSVSYQVTRYMVALKRRKVREGGLQTMTSRAITSSDIRNIYKFNNSNGHDIIRPYNGSTPRSCKLKEWGGPRARLLVHAVVTLSFICLLRVDEVLKLCFEDIVVYPGNRLRVTLPSRKNAQYGGVKPYDLYPLPEDHKALCPVRALARWVIASNLKSGPLFRAPGSGDRAPNPTAEVPITSSRFIELFRNNLIDIGIDPTIYAGHSMRRGGCQYFVFELRWSLFRVCDWGGWSKDFDHLTIIRYIFSITDDPHEPREQYLNPNRPLAVLCNHCGRRCWCF